MASHQAQPLRCPKQGTYLSESCPKTIPTPTSLSTTGRCLQRRGVLRLGVFLAFGIVSEEAEANVLEDLAKSLLRPDLDLQEALVAVLDARSGLKEIQAVASSPKDSTERVKINPILPGGEGLHSCVEYAVGIAKRLRAIGAAAPVVAAASSGVEKEENVSVRYGGNATEAAIVDEVYAAVGAVLTLSGRAVRPELLVSETPTIQNAIDLISRLIEEVPKEELEKAQEFRIKRLES